MAGQGRQLPRRRRRDRPGPAGGGRRAAARPPAPTWSGCERVRLADGVADRLRGRRRRSPSTRAVLDADLAAGSLHPRSRRSASSPRRRRARSPPGSPAGPRWRCSTSRRAPPCSSSCASCSTSTAARSSAPRPATSPTATSSTSSTPTRFGPCIGRGCDQCPDRYAQSMGCGSGIGAGGGGSGSGGTGNIRVRDDRIGHIGVGDDRWERRRVGHGMGLPRRPGSDAAELGDAGMTAGGWTSAPMPASCDRVASAAPRPHEADLSGLRRRLEPRRGPRARRRWRRRRRRARPGRSRTSRSGTRTLWRRTAPGSAPAGHPRPRRPRRRSRRAPATRIGDHVGDRHAEVVGDRRDRRGRPFVAGPAAANDVLDRRLPRQAGQRAGRRPPPPGSPGCRSRTAARRLTTIWWAISPARPWRPACSLPSTTTPPPIPVPSTRQTTVGAPGRRADAAPRPA